VIGAILGALGELYAAQGKEAKAQQAYKDATVWLIRLMRMICGWGI